jgi:hypothetical protein
MDFGKHIGKALAPMTFAAAMAWHAALSAVEKEEVIGYELTITDKPSQEIWKCGVSGIFPIVQVTAASTVKVDVNGAEQTFEQGQAIKLVDKGLFKFSVDPTSGAISHSVEGTAADNGKILGFGPDGSTSPVALPVQKTVTIDPASQGFMAVENLPTEFRIKLTESGITRVKVDEASANLAAARTALAATGHDLQEADSIFLAAGGNKLYMAASGANLTSDNNWILVKANLTLAEIGTLIGGELGVAYSVTTGKMRMDLREVTVGKRNNIELEGNKAFVDVMSVTSIINNIDQSLEKHLGDISTTANTAYNRQYENALTKTVDSVTGAQKVVFGGDFTEPTAVDSKDEIVDFDGTGTGVYRVNGLWRFTNAACLFEGVDPTGKVRKFKLNQWGILDTSEFNPNL